MDYQIADLIVELPAAGDLVSRCKAYILDTQDNVAPDIRIHQKRFRDNVWGNLSGDAYVYMESGAHFMMQLLKYDGFVLHASAVEYEGKAYLFSAPSGTGKSTHTRMWQAFFDKDAKVFNDDKPALRRLDGKWYAYGTPWCGKDGININMKVPLAGICFLKQSSENKIRRLSKKEAIHNILWQTMHKFYKEERLDLMLSLVEKLVNEIPVFELENRPEREAAMLSYETMRNAALEMGL